MEGPRAVLVIGAQAAGKSTVGRALAERFELGAFIEGDLLWKMVVAGGVDMSREADGAAERQVALRYRHGAMLAESFVANGFTAVHADNMYGAAVATHLRSLHCPASLVVLRPTPEAIEHRERQRGKSAYAGWMTDGMSLLDAIRQFDAWLAESPRVGLWLDSSEMTPAQTVDEIMRRWPETFVGDLDGSFS